MNQLYVNAVRGVSDWQEGRECFASKLLDLYASADKVGDAQEIRRLRRGFPNLLMAYDDWHKAEDRVAFFEDAFSAARA